MTPLLYKYQLNTYVDFAAKKAQCFQAGLNLTNFELIWDVKAEEMMLMNY